MKNRSMFRFAAIMLAVTRLHAGPAPKAFPNGTKAVASFATDGDRGKVENLIDGDSATSMSGAAASCKGPTDPVWIDFAFPRPVADLVGVETGKSDPFKNYYPKQAQFWVDTDGNGTFDTLGASVKLGPSDESAGQHLFAGRIPKAHGLRFLVTEQNQAGLNRCFMMNEMGLLVDPAADPMATTPDAKSEDAILALKAAKEAADKAAAEARRRNAPKPHQSIVPGSEKLPGVILPLPSNTVVRCSMGTEKDGGPSALFDGNPETVLRAVSGSCGSPFSTASIFLRFPEPVADIGGVETGNSDPFHNYYPVEMEFWGDSDGDGRCDTLLGRTRKLGPAAQCVGRHRFDARLPLAHGLEIRAVEQHVGGGRRAFQMDEMRLVRDPDLPIAEATPLSYRDLFYKSAMPAGTTISASFATEDGGGPEVLLDSDPTTFMNAKQGTAKAGVPASLFLRFAKPVSDLAGIQLGNSDPFKNYVWKEMQVWADTTGNGVYDTLAATLESGAGERRFRKPVTKAYGLELRVTQQSLQGTYRCFMLNEIGGLVFKDSAGETEMRYVVEDFEDLSSWRTWANNTAQPEGERYYGKYTYLVGDYRPELAKSGVGVGRVRCCFKNGRSSLWATRGRVAAEEGIVEGIRFWGNPQGYECSVHFEMVDAKGRRFHTPSVKLTGNAWQEYSIDTSAKSIPAVSEMTYPFVLKHIFLDTDKGGIGDVLLDNIAFVGAVDRGKRVRIRPVYTGLGYDPAKPLKIQYRLWNALGRDVVAPLEAKLFSSFDPKHTAVVAQKTQAVALAPYSDAVVTVDFGAVPVGHYEALLSLEAEGVSAELRDPVAVLTLNGGRINKKPMWFGSQHPGDWLADAENQFVFKHVAVPLGLDCYRTGAPDKDIIEAGMFCAAMFGGVPPALRPADRKGDDRVEPTDYAAYAEWCKRQAREKYLPYADKILSIEYYNEPDLPDFCYLPEIDTYLKMHRTFAQAFREVIPGIKIGTGGNTVRHGKEKKDFNPRMYTELAKEADVAIWHAHGPLENYIGLQRLVEDWLEKGGRPGEQMLLGNSEAGIPGGESAVGSLNQADNLVKKIGWAKSQKNSYFYVWFTTTDTYDPQGGYLNNENWGLVTCNQRLKPSGQAYNELIRKLANTEGLGEVDLDERLQACAYRRDDGTQVWLVWPRERGAVLSLRFAASGPVVLTDLFGASRTVAPEKGILRFEGKRLALLCRSAEGRSRSERRPPPEFVSYASVLGVPPGAEISVPVTLRNVWGRAGDAEDPRRVRPDGVVFADGSNETSRKCRRDRQPGLDAVASGFIWFARMRPLLVSSDDPGGGRSAAADAGRSRNGRKGRAVRHRRRAGQTPERTPPSFSIRSGSCANLSPIRTPSVSEGRGRSFGQGSLRTRWEGRPISASMFKTKATTRERRAQSCGPRIAFKWLLYAGDAHTEIGLTEAEGGFGWCWIAPDAAYANRKMTTPLAVKRTGNHTIYEAYLPFDFLGIKAYAPMLPLRLAFLVNEDDGRGRVRILHWFDGIAADKSSDLFGHLVLE
ncbi:MAG: hypothetical protein ACOX5G_11655 [Kiritimatiellia bacterium]